MKKITRRSFLALTGSLALGTTLAACNTSSTGGITSLDGLAGKSVGVQLGSMADLYATADEDLALQEVVQYTKYTDAVQALRADIIDAVITAEQVGQAFVDTYPEELTMFDAAYPDVSCAICLSKETPALTAAFNEALATLQTNGTIDAILDKYITKTEGAAGYVSATTDYPNGTLTMGTNAYFEPYEYYEGDTITGLDPEIAKAICDTLGYDLVIEDMEFDSIIIATNTGKVDFGMACIAITEERLANVDFTDVYYTEKQIVLVKQ